jgi:hypothetical protein
MVHSLVFFFWAQQTFVLCLLCMYYFWRLANSTDTSVCYKGWINPSKGSGNYIVPPVFTLKNNCIPPCGSCGLYNIVWRKGKYWPLFLVATLPFLWASILYTALLTPTASLMPHGPILPFAVSILLLFTHSLLFYTEDGDSRFLRNVGKNLPDYTTSRLNRE